MDKQAREAREMVKNLTFKEKAKHFWYYYRRQTFGIIFVVALIVLGVTECANQTKYDLSIAYYSSSYVNREAVDALADTLESVVKDITGNGVTDVFISLTQADISADTYNEMTEAALTKIPVELSADEYQMYILDEAYLEFFNRAYEGVVQSTVLLSDIPEVSEALGFSEDEKVYLVMTVEFEQSKGDAAKTAERENAALVEQYFADMLK